MKLTLILFYFSKAVQCVVKVPLCDVQ